MQNTDKTIQWLEKLVPLKDLRPFEKNPRHITNEQFEKLKQSLSQDGYHSRIKVTQDMRVVGGHQRLQALLELGFKEVPVLIPDRAIDDATFKRILLRDNHNNGVFDMEILGNEFELEFLRDIGLHDIMNIPPFEEGNAEEGGGKSMVCCPDCGKVFPVKGNKAGV